MKHYILKYKRWIIVLVSTYNNIYIITIIHKLTKGILSKYDEIVVIERNKIIDIGTF